MVENTPCPEAEPRKQMEVKLLLFLYDVRIFVLTDLLLLVLHRGGKILSLACVLQQSLVAFVCIFTGGGGSIGSELCRQPAKMDTKQLIVVDIYENSAYDLQQGLLFVYKNKVDIRMEIVSITNKGGLERAFEEYHPDIYINAAAHSMYR